MHASGWSEGRAEWSRLESELGLVRADELGEDLLLRYAEPHRRYHDQAHLLTVLRTLDELAPEGAPAAVRLAAWFHDAIYDPRREDNETASARLAERSLAPFGLAERIRTEVGRLVRLTASHDPTPDDWSAALLCDADLAVLATSATEYERYRSAIRAEYAHLPDADFRTGRRLLLRALLSRTAIYRTRAGHLRYETAARANISRELAVLADAAVPPR